MAIDTQVDGLAKGLFDTGVEARQPSKFLGELRKVADLTMDPAVMAMLNSNSPVAERLRLFTERVGDMGAEVKGIVAFLLEKNRIAELPYVSIRYQSLLDDYYCVQGAEIAEVTTAVALDDEYLLSLGKKLTDIMGRPVVIKPFVDASIVGGIRIRIGDKLIDGSLRRKLDMLGKELV